ncbi:hypothetical protein [Parafrankia sp. FMc2]|uniref:hypothetical protein n=1 Tax=Parafrankia sp. FMc2 TaxID=3233196 RepID=UPI0034D4FF5C
MPRPTPPPAGDELAQYRRRRDRILAAHGPLTVRQRDQLAAVNARITALGG